MNKISRNATGYSQNNVEFKLLDLFSKAADKIVAERYENIN